MFPFFDAAVEECHGDIKRGVVLGDGLDLIDARFAVVAHQERIGELEGFFVCVVHYTAAGSLWRLRSSVQSESLNVCGREIVRLRGQQSLSQEQLAMKCQLAGWDVSRDIIANIELGRRIISDLELSILARVLDAPLKELYPAKIRVKLR